jgi:hypothetical protein
MIVVTVRDPCSPDQLRRFEAAITQALRRGDPIVIPDNITITTHPRHPNWRAKRGHTPRWTRTPRIRTTHPNRNDT